MTCQNFLIPFDSDIISVGLAFTVDSPVDMVDTHNDRHLDIFYKKISIRSRLKITTLYASYYDFHIYTPIMVHKLLAKTILTTTTILTSVFNLWEGVSML